MSRVISIVTVMCVAVAGVVLNLNAQDRTVRAAIDEGNKGFMAAFARGDTAALAEFYTTDGEAFPPNGDVVRGHAALQQMWKSVVDGGIASATLTTREVESSGDLASESGTYEMKTKDGTVADRGKYIVVWKRVGGKWLLHRDIWNTSMPAAK